MVLQMSAKEEVLDIASMRDLLQAGSLLCHPTHGIAHTTCLETGKSFLIIIWSNLDLFENYLTSELP